MAKNPKPIVGFTKTSTSLKVRTHWKDGLRCCPRDPGLDDRKVKWDFKDDTGTVIYTTGFKNDNKAAMPDMGEGSTYSCLQIPEGYTSLKGYLEAQGITVVGDITICYTAVNGCEEECTREFVCAPETQVALGGSCCVKVERSRKDVVIVLPNAADATDTFIIAADSDGEIVPESVKMFANSNRQACGEAEYGYSVAIEANGDAKVTATQVWGPEGANNPCVILLEYKVLEESCC